MWTAFSLFARDDDCIRKESSNRCEACMHAPQVVDVGIHNISICVHQHTRSPTTGRSYSEQLVALLAENEMKGCVSVKLLDRFNKKVFETFPLILLVLPTALVEAG